MLMGAGVTSLGAAVGVPSAAAAARPAFVAARAVFVTAPSLVRCIMRGTYFGSRVRTGGPINGH